MNTDKKIVVEGCIDEIRKELQSATKKHPEFAPGGFFKYPADRHDEVAAALDEELRQRRAISDVRNDVVSIITEEVMEGTQAALKGDYKNAYIEFAQVAAVAVRAMMMCEAEQEGNK